MQKTDEIDQIAKALAAFQRDMPVLPKTRTAKIYGKGGTRTYTYADISDLLQAALPVLSKHGLSVTQMTEVRDGYLYLRTVVLHTSGQWMAGIYPVSEFTAHQVMGASMTYSRRYALSAALGVASDEDVDGDVGEYQTPPPPPAKASQRPPTFDAQTSHRTAEWLIDKLAEVNDRTALSNWATDTEKDRQSLRSEDYERVKDAFLNTQDRIARGERA